MNEFQMHQNKLRVAAINLDAVATTTQCDDDDDSGCEAASKKVSAGQQQQKCNTINSSQCNTHLMVLSCSGKQESALPVMAQRRPCHATYTECTFL